MASTIEPTAVRRTMINRAAGVGGHAVPVLLRPEFTAVLGTIVVFTYFALTAGDAGFLSTQGTLNYFEVAAEVGIIATFVTLLMIAGEFDLSVGSMMGCGAIVASYAVVEGHLPLAVALALAFIVACVVGAVNWFLVVKIGLPSFIVTLGTLYLVRGLTTAITRSVTSGETQIGGIADTARGDFLAPLFGGTVFGVSASIVWWVVLSLFAAWVLDRTRVGNWIYATGGDRESARRAGVPVNRVKLGLFVCTAAASALVGVLAAFEVNSAEVTLGTLKEFEAATATVIGGTLLTGGYGSPIGTLFGALLFGMVSQGFFFTDIPDEWYQGFLGFMLLMSVVVNTYTRRVALRRKAR